MNIFGDALDSQWILPLIVLAAGILVLIVHWGEPLIDLIRYGVFRKAPEEDSRKLGWKDTIPIAVIAVRALWDEIRARVARFVLGMSDVRDLVRSYARAMGCPRDLDGGNGD